MPIASNPIYSVEQIKIPQELPDVMKEYSKFIIRQQPNDIMAASADYFNQLLKSRQDKNRKGVSESQLEILYLKLDNFDTPRLETKAVRTACEQAKIPGPLVEEMLRMGGWRDQVQWMRFWALAVSSSTSDLLATMEMCIRIMAIDHTKVNPTKILDVFTFLAERDQKIPKWKLDSANKLLSNTELNDMTVLRDEFRKLLTN